MNEEPKITYAPWPKEVVDKLNEYQHNLGCHPYTCGWCRDKLGVWFVKQNDGTLIPEPLNYDRSGDGWKKIICLDRELIATENGWICKTCDHVQNWYVEGTI
jgi:hypothetical protein